MKIFMLYLPLLAAVATRFLLIDLERSEILYGASLLFGSHPTAHTAHLKGSGN